MLSFNLFDSNEWEVISNEAEVEALKAKIKALEYEISMNKVATLEADNDSLRNLNKNMKSVIKNNSDYISKLESKVNRLELHNKDLERANIKLCDQIAKANISVIENKIEAVESNTDIAIHTIKDLNTKINNQSKEITRLLKAQEKLKTEIVDKEQIISSLDAKCNILSKKVRELNEGIRNPDDLTWKQKYDALLLSSERAIDALQKKCQEYKNVDTDATVNTIAALVKENNELKEKSEKLKKLVNSVYGVASKSRTIDGCISELENKVAKLEEENNEKAETFDKINDLIHGQE